MTAKFARFIPLCQRRSDRSKTYIQQRKEKVGVNMEGSIVRGGRRKRGGEGGGLTWCPTELYPEASTTRAHTT